MTSVQDPGPRSGQKAVPPPGAGVVAISGRTRGLVAGPQSVMERDERVYGQSLHLLGGKKFWRHARNKSEVHSTIVDGVPFGSLIFFVSNVKGLAEEDVVKVLGISTRTLRRQSETPEKSMPADLASKAWLFAETLAKATEIFGTKDEAERWMSRPAMGLDGQRPIDLLQTVQGTELVNDFLVRLEYGVYT
jgi:putative toxin-antitoxin system antitoxin component (TIGR02293 family)